MNIFDKLKLPFAKKVKQVPVSWVEEGPEHYYVIHHLLFGYSDSTSVPNGYADVVYLLMAIPVLSQQASDGDVPFYALGVPSSRLSFSQIARLSWYISSAPVKSLCARNISPTRR